jgi:hypothetical protein
MQALVRPLGVALRRCVAREKKMPARILRGWELKPYAILHSRFKDVLLLDADNVPVVNPAFLSPHRSFAPPGPSSGRTASMGSFAADLEHGGVPYREEPEFETGQIVVDKQRCWRRCN